MSDKLPGPGFPIVRALNIGSAPGVTIGTVDQGAPGASPWKVDDDATQVILAAIQVLLAAGLPAALAAGGGLKVEGVAGGVAQPVSSAQPAAVTMQNAAVATGNGTVYACPGLSGVMVQCTFAGTATITWEEQVDGSTFSSVLALNLATGVTATTATATGLYWVPTPNVLQLRARISSWVSGAVTAVGLGAFGPPPYVIALLAQSLSYEDFTNGVAKIAGQFNTTNITTQTTTSPKASAGVMAGYSINKPLANGTIAFYDDPTTTNNLFATVTQPAALLSSGPIYVPMPKAFANGLTIVTGAANQDITVFWI